MSPFRRGKYWSLYVPRQSGGVVQRACGTTDAKLAKAMGRMIDTLADQRRWDVLEAIDHKRVTVGQAYDAFAMNRLDEMLAEQAKRDEPTVDQYLGAWLHTLHAAPRTLASYEQKVRALLGDAPPTRSALTAGWVMDRVGSLTHTAATVRQYAHAFSLFCQYLEAHELLPENPVRRVRLPRGTNKRTVWKSIDEDLRLVNATHEPLRSFFALVHATGAERDAAMVMVRSDLDLTAATCHVPGTKTKSRDRKGVPIESWALPILTAHCKGLLPDAPLFPGITRHAISHGHLDARRVAKLPGYQLRDARHSYAVRAILRGEPLWAVSKWLGHANIGITASVYAHFDLEAALSELNRSTTPRATRGGVAS